jgi:hypothetical protein
MEGPSACAMEFNNFSARRRVSVILSRRDAILRATVDEDGHYVFAVAP